MILSDNLFLELVHAASLAPSADNMQPWEFHKQEDMIEVFCAKPRVLPTDVIGMFAWVGIGAAIQNIVLAAASKGIITSVEYSVPVVADDVVAIVKLSSGGENDPLANWIPTRNTNRSPYEALPLHSELISRLTKKVLGLNGGLHWMTEALGFELMASIDANSTYIRLEHKPLHDELFDILRFSRKDIERTRFGLTFESLEVPPFAVFFARQLQYWSVNRLISNLGFGRLVAKQLSNKLLKAGALCLVTSYRRDPVGYMEAGRVMEQLWLAATAEGLSIQPYGVLPQYLTKVDIEPETFLPKYVTIINGHRERFYSLFPEAKNDYPAILLRVGRSKKQSARSDIRLLYSQIIRK